MNKNYTVIYDKKKCASATKCINIHPNLWEKGPDGKAILRGGKLNRKTGKYELAIQEKDFKAFKESALICPVFVIDIVDNTTGKSVLNLKPTKEEDKEKVPIILAYYNSRKEWQMDPKGYFTVKPFPKEKLIRVRYYTADNSLKLMIEGKTAEELYNTIVREGLVSTLRHAAYVGCELMKAEIAMKKNWPYVQDTPFL